MNEPNAATLVERANIRPVVRLATLALRVGSVFVWSTLLACVMFACDRTSPESTSRQHTRVPGSAAQGPKARSERNLPSEADDPAAPTQATSESTSHALEAPRSTASREQGHARLTNWVVITTGGASERRALPWIVALHGLGDRPEAFKGLFSELQFQAHVVLPRAPLDYGRGYDWFGARVSGDPERLKRGVERATAQLAALVRQLALEARFVGKPIVTGFSQGGILSFSMALHHPELVSASLPIGGWLPPELVSSQAPRGVPIIAFHGQDDRVVPFKPTVELTSQLLTAGFDVQLRSYPGIAHRVDASIHRDWAAELARLCARQSPR